MEQLQEVPRVEIDKAFIDASAPGIDIVIDSSSRTGQYERGAIAQALFRLLQRMENQQTPILLLPLRFILVTANLSKEVNFWNRELGLPESGVSNQTEGSVVGKHMFWGTDLESARSIILLADGLAVAVAADLSVAITSVIHELGHVHDDFARGLTMGFPQSRPCNLNDWPGICAQFADITWSEYAAESTAAAYMTREDLAELVLNDPTHLVGINKRLRQLIQSNKLGQLDFPSLWSRAVTDISDLFANLGRAAARFRFAENGEQARAGFVDATGEAASWKPIVERLFNELNALGEKNYSEWDSEPFRGLGEVMALGFNAAGFLPIPVGDGLRVKLR